MNVIKLNSNLALKPNLKRVAAYARVSSGKDTMLHSIAAQVSYYSELIKANQDWDFVGVYHDTAMTGTKDNRDGFQALLKACRDGAVDMVITKSISRFARNTVTLLSIVRELKSLGIDVYFEEQNIHTLSSDGELMLTILASYAQEESLSASENQKWRIKRNFQNGVPWNVSLLGYRLLDNQLRYEPSEAQTVRRIYSLYLEGHGLSSIADTLNNDHIPTRFGNAWCKSAVRCVLSNYTYTGNLLLQSTYSENHISKKKMFNNGEYPMYHVEGSHEPIIDLETFNKVQDEMKRRALKHCPAGRKPSRYPFSGKLVCSICGKKYRRKKTASGPVWICSTFNSLGKAACPSKQIPESTLEAITADIPEYTTITVCPDNLLLIHTPDGTLERTWKDRRKCLCRK